MNIRKIPPYVTDAVQNSNTAAKPGAQDKSAGVSGVSSDRVQLSQNYQDLAQAQNAITATNDVRTEKLQQIKSQLENGSYQVNPGQIASNMLDEII